MMMYLLYIGQFFFIGFVVYHLRTEAISFHNFVTVLSIGDDAKGLC